MSQPPSYQTFSSPSAPVTIQRDRNPDSNSTPITSETSIQQDQDAEWNFLLNSSDYPTQLGPENLEEDADPNLIPPSPPMEITSLHSYTSTLTSASSSSSSSGLSSTTSTIRYRPREPTLDVEQCNWEDVVMMLIMLFVVLLALMVWLVFVDRY